MDGDVDGGEICQPQCEDLECGPDMCGGICGWCPEGKICKLGDCKNCSPDCEYSECGPDGCGGLCGTCPAKFLCVDGNCTPPGCNGYELIFEERFDTCTQGGFQIFDEQPDDPVTWHALPINHYSPPCALYLGDPQTFTYFTGSTVTVKLRSPIVAIPYTSAWRLSFRLLLDAEPVPMPLYPYDYDVLFLAFVEEGTEVEELLWSSKEILNTTDGELIPMAIELSKLAGRTGRFLFTFDTFDSTDNDYLGVHLDDVLVESVCPYCIDAEDCEDGVPCTFNKCVMFGNESAIGSCFYEPIADCCIGQEEAFCDDLNPCTDDFCDDEVVTCVYTEIPGCDPDNP